MHNVRRLGLVAFIFLFTLRVSAQAVSCDFPGADWERAELGSVGIDATYFDEVDTVIEDDLPYLRSLLIVRHGCLVYEQYFDDADDTTLFNIFSVTKSVTATLIGIAIEEEHIESVDSPIMDYLPAQYFTNNDLRQSITVEHLLKMLSGLGWNEDRHIGGMLRLQRDEVGFILGLLLDHPPGTTWNYSTADSHLLSAVLTEATSKTALEYATPHLFEPLGIDVVMWTEDVEGHNLGGTQLFLRSADMARLGLLYLREGMWDGEQIVPAEWVKYVTTPQLRDPSVYELSYAAHWWHVHLDNYPAMFAALGYGGQYIIVAPEQDMVIVATANSYIREPNTYIAASSARRQEEAVLDFVEEVILPAVED